MSRRNGRRVIVAVGLVVWCLSGCTDAHVYVLGEGAVERAGYVRAYEESGGEAAVGKPATGVEPWSFGCRQQLKGGRSKSAVLLQQPCGQNQQVFAVADEFWDLYRRAGDHAPLRYGFPLGRRGEWNGGLTQGFGRGGGMQSFFMQRPGGPPFVVAGSLLEHYLSFEDREVRLGYPTSNAWTTASGGLCQKFEHGVLASNGGECGEVRTVR